MSELDHMCSNCGHAVRQDELKCPVCSGILLCELDHMCSNCRRVVRQDELKCPVCSGILLCPGSENE